MLIGILLILLAASIYIIRGLTEAYINLYMQQNSEYIINENIEEHIPCSLLLRHDKELNYGDGGIIFDFSSYEQNGIVGLTTYGNYCPPTDQVLLISNQEVYKMKDGSYYWEPNWQ